MNARRVWRGSMADWEAGGETLPTGYEALDAALPGGGWPAASLTEIVVDRFGLGELRLLLPTLTRLSRETAPGETDSRWIVWVSPPFIPYAPALASAGLSLSRTLLVDAGEGMDRLWAAEQALRSGACAAVLMWAGRLDEKRLRRLQLAAETGSAWGVLCRSPEALDGHSPAALRVRLSPTGAGVDLSILKSRGGRPQRLSLQL